MALRDSLRDLILGPAVASDTVADVSHFERAAVPDTFAPVWARASSLGLGSQAARTPEQIRTAFRGIVHACATLRADAVAEGMMKAQAHRAVGPGEWQAVEPAHPWALLLASPSAAFSARYVYRWAQLAKDLGRGAFFFVERDRRGVPVSLLPVFEQFGYVVPVAGASGGIASYVYMRADGRRFDVEARDVVWVRHAHPLDPTEGVSLLQAAAYEIDADLYARIYQRDTMREGGSVRTQIVTDQDIPDKEFARRLSEQFVAMKAGGLPPVFSRGAKAEPLGLSAADMEFVEAVGLNEAGIYRLFRVPEGLFSDKANRANAEAARFMFYGSAVQPEADDMADQITHDWRRAFGADPAARLTVRVPDLVPVDVEQQARIDEIQIRSGARVLNDVRERDGLQPFANGAQPLVSAALTPLDTLYARPEPRPPQTAPAPPVEDEDADDDAEPERAAPSGRPPQTAPAPPVEDEDAALAAWRAVESARMDGYRPLLAQASDLFEAMAAEVVSGIERAHASHTRRDGDPAAQGLVARMLLAIDRWTAEIERLFEPLTRRALRDGFDFAALSVSYSGTVDMQSAAVRDAIRAIVEAMRGVPETAADSLQQAILESLAAQENAPALARRIRALFGDMQAYKAEQIARTASTAAFEAGQQEAFREAGITRSRWLSQRDGAVRESHRSVDGEERAIGERFSNGLLYPGEAGAPASQVVNCRCTVLPLTDARSVPPTAGREEAPQGAEPMVPGDLVPYMSRADRDRVAVSARNARIRRDYPALRDSYGRGPALSRLAERESVSEDTVRSLVYRG